jgi:redox-sensitive bicupin YhaK (pirin superfamily)
VLEGSQEHRDSTGEAGVLRADDVRWMTAGRGVLHSELSRGGFHGLQLWFDPPQTFRPLLNRRRRSRSGYAPRASSAQRKPPPNTCRHGPSTRGVVARSTPEASHAVSWRFKPPNRRDWREGEGASGGSRRPGVRLLRLDHLCWYKSCCNQTL